MTYSERYAITSAASQLFHRFGCHQFQGDEQEQAASFCGCDRSDSPHVCPFQQLCENHELEYGCDVWELSMGEDL